MVFVGLKLHSATAMCIALQPSADACSGTKDKRSSEEQVADMLLLMLGLSVCSKTFLHAPHMRSGLILSLATHLKDIQGQLEAQGVKDTALHVWLQQASRSIWGKKHPDHANTVWCCNAQKHQQVGYVRDQNQFRHVLHFAVATHVAFVTQRCEQPIQQDHTCTPARSLVSARDKFATTMIADFACEQIWSRCLRRSGC